ncbi:MAG: tRNA (N6-isopentenyl adenosine(37)-C2)-methylthiotransferase MiaB [Acidobacteriota bacterium]
MAHRFFIETFGCQMNQHDSEKIAGLLAHQGMVAVSGPDEADLLILNTCSVREKAVQKMYSRLGEFKARKRSDPDFLIGVVGCVAQQEGEALVQKAPFVDLVVGTHMYHAIPDLLEQSRRGRGRVATRFEQGPLPAEIAPVRRGNDFRANITIMEGCNKRCAFCIVPFTRGRERNRPARSILEEVSRAAQEGFVEVLLLGQTVNSYKDPGNPRFKFAQLLARLAEVRGLRRIRFTSPHPVEFCDETIAVIDAHEVICNQVHLPLQSGSTAVLKRMRRQYTRDWFLTLVEKFRRGRRRIAFSTDVIVGFPGESEQDFEQTLSLVRQVEFESMFSFKYSVRPQTEAQPWKDDVPKDVKTRRLMLLQRLQKGIQLDLHQRHYLGREAEVLVEGVARDGRQRSGRTATGRIVNFPGNQSPGEFVKVQITRVGPNSLQGAALGEPSQTAAGMPIKEPEWNVNSESRV